VPLAAPAECAGDLAERQDAVAVIGLAARRRQLFYEKPPAPTWVIDNQ
jgi:hypothetical protein